MIPPEFAPTRTETQRTGDDIVTAVRNLRHDWPHMIRPGETQAPGRVKADGAAQGGREKDAAVTDDFGRTRYPGDQSPEPGQEKWCPATDTDVRRIDKVLSLRAHVTARLNGWCRVIVEDRGTKAGIPLGTDVPGMAAFLQRHADWLGEHEAATDCRDEIVGLAKRCHLVAYPRRRDSMSIGRCPLQVLGEADVMVECGGDVRARTTDAHHVDGKVWAACNQCGEVSPCDWWAERMFVDGEGSPLVTAGELIAVIAYRLEVVVTHEQIRQWKTRGKIKAEGTDGRGRTLFRHEEVVDSIRADVRAKAARASKMAG